MKTPGEKRSLPFYMALVPFILLSLQISAHAVSKIVNFEEKIGKEIDTITVWAAMPIIVDAVNDQNALGLTMDTLLRRDSSWIATVKSKGALSEFMKNAINSPAGKWLNSLRKKSGGKYRECFICDNRGALVATSGRTTDYFQGDEAKWVDCFNNGQGKAISGQPEYDESADAKLIYLSVPVKSGGKTVGVLLVGVKVASLQ